MKKTGILNSPISRVLAYMRHTDTLCIGDCGLPCPDETELIDVALAPNVPRFIEVLTLVVQEMQLERVIVAEEIRQANPAVFNRLTALLKDVPIAFVSHTELKQRLSTCKAVIRSGEASPYANIILQSGCLF